jgi:plasmid stabilization system protein ParE
VSDPRAAGDELLERIHAAVAKLADFPESGSIVPEFSDSALREVIVWPFRVVYRYLRTSLVRFRL